MAFGDKLKFWKKEEEDFSDLGDFGLGDFGGGPGGAGAPGQPAPGGAQTGTGPMPNEEDVFGKGFGDFGMGGTPGFGAEPAQPQPAEQGYGQPLQQQSVQPDYGDMGGMSQPTFPTQQQRMGMQQPMQPQPQQQMMQSMPAQMQQPMQPQPQQFAQPQPQYAYAAPQTPDNFHREAYSKDIEIVSAKLDSLRATLESINQRLANLERIAQGESRETKRGYEW